MSISLPLDSSPGISRPTLRPEIDGTTPACPAGCLDLSPDWPLEHGGTIPAGRLAYEITGPDDAPLLVVAGGISASRHVTASSERPEPGWWPSQAGPGQPIDTRRFRVLGFDFLGGSGTSTGASELTPPRPNAAPCISTADQARALAVLLDHLGIDRCAAFVGASYGGMVGLAFAARFPSRLEQLIVISASDTSHPQSTAWRSVQRRIVRLARAHDATEDGLALARSLAMVTYRSPAELEKRFSDSPRATAEGFTFPVETYLEHCGQTFAHRFDAEAFLCLSESIDLHRVDPTAIEVPVTLVSVSSDQLVPPAQIEELSRRVAGPCRLVEIHSLYGHDAFLKETETLGLVLRGCLASQEVC